MKPQVVVVDYGVGNVGSIQNMLSKSGISSRLSNEPGEVENATKIILPGVGAFDTAALKLAENGMNEAIIGAANSGVPILGVCLGMQLLFESSSEGSQSGLGLIKGTTQKFEPEVNLNSQLPVPHMGWNSVSRRKASAFLPELGEDSRYYFVHSFFVVPERPEDVLGTTEYGFRFTSAVERDNILGVQFHPEKSHKHGSLLLRDFASAK